MSETMIPGRNTVGATSTDEWETPNDLWQALHEQYEFTVDAAASAANTKCVKYYSKERSFLTQFRYQWLETIWCNPPFSLSREFMETLHRSGRPAVAIFKANNLETAAWRPIWELASWVKILTPRVNYCLDGKPVKGVTFASALIGFRCSAPPSYVRGVLLTHWERP